MIQQGVAAVPIGQTLNGTFTGPFAVGQASSPLITKCGKQVTLEIPAMSAAAASTAAATVAALVPSGFRPQATVTSPVSVISNSVNLASPGKIAVNTSGDITIYANLVQSTTFSASGNNGWDRIVITWITA